MSSGDRPVASPNDAYGTFVEYGVESKPNRMTDDSPRRGGQRDASSPADIVMRPLADQLLAEDDNEYAASEQSDDTTVASAQAGVKRAEAISSTWSRTGLLVAYFGIGLLAFATSLEAQTTSNLTIFATSAFSSHSLAATVGVVQAVVLSVAKPPMSKIADVLGRFEAFTLSVVIFVAGYIQQAASTSIETYAAAQIFYSAGSTGLQILIQIFIADTSDLLNRALCSTIPQIPFLFTVFIGPVLAQGVLQTSSWRLGYAIWILILPVAFLPLALALVINQRKAAKQGLIPPSQFEDKSGFEVAKTIWYELDVFGLVLICTAFSLLLIPLTLVARTGWKNGSIITMLALGVVCLIAFPFWERSKTLAPRAFFPRELFRQKTVVVGLALAFFYFMAFYLSIYPYFQSYLLVVHDMSVSAAGLLVQTFTFSATVTSVFVSLAIKRLKHYKLFVVTGSVIYVLGLGLMLGYRTESASIGIIVCTQIVVGVGGGMLNVPAQLGVQASATHQEVASATAVFLTVLEIGGAFGNAISGAIWTNSLPGKLDLYLPAETKDQAGAIYANITLAANHWPMGSPTRVAINRAYQETMTRILTVAVCVAAPCILFSWLMQNYKLDEIDQNVKGLVIGGTQDIADRRESFSVVAASRSSSMAIDAVNGDDDDVVEDQWDDEQGQRRSLIPKPRKRT